MGVGLFLSYSIVGLISSSPEGYLHGTCKKSATPSSVAELVSVPF